MTTHAFPLLIIPAQTLSYPPLCPSPPPPPTAPTAARTPPHTAAAPRTRGPGTNAEPPAWPARCAPRPLPTARRLTREHASRPPHVRTTRPMSRGRAPPLAPPPTPLTATRVSHCHAAAHGADLRRLCPVTCRVCLPPCGAAAAVAAEVFVGADCAAHRESGKCVTAAVAAACPVGCAEPRGRRCMGRGAEVLLSCIA